MTAKELWQYLNNGELDFEFEFKGKSGTICLCHLPAVYVIYDGFELTTSLKALMNEPFLDGKSLSQVALEIEFYG